MIGFCCITTTVDISVWFVSPKDLIIIIPHRFDDPEPDIGTLSVVVYCPLPSLLHVSERPTTYIRPLNGSTVRNVTFIYCSEHITVKSRHGTLSMYVAPRSGFNARGPTLTVSSL
jgi:hypothetical protein